MLGDLAEWTDPMVADVTDGLLSKVSSLEPLLHQPASPASRATAHPCTYALEPPLSEASDLPAPELTASSALYRRCSRMHSQVIRGCTVIFGNLFESMLNKLVGHVEAG